jgi:hypothetical protein
VADPARVELGAGPLVTAGEAASELGCSSELIRLAAKRGELPVLRTRRGRAFFFAQHVFAWNERRLQRKGRPAACAKGVSQG